MKKIIALLTVLALLLALSVPAAFAEEEAGTMVTLRAGGFCRGGSGNDGHRGPL